MVSCDQIQSYFLFLSIEWGSLNSALQNQRVNTAVVYYSKFGFVARIPFALHWNCLFSTISKILRGMEARPSTASQSARQMKCALWKYISTIYLWALPHLFKSFTAVLWFFQIWCHSTIRQVFNDNLKLWNFFFLLFYVFVFILAAKHGEILVFWLQPKYILKWETFKNSSVSMYYNKQDTLLKQP